MKQNNLYPVKKENSTSVNKENEDVIKSLKMAVSYFRSQHKKDASIDKVNLELKYKENLAYINNLLGIDLNYSEEEIQAIESSLKPGYLLNGFLLSEEEYQRNIQIIKENGGYEMFLEAQKIIEQVYKNDPTFGKMSWGCGIALASNFVATLGLTACVTGVGCPLAIAGKALALAGVATSC